MRGPARPRQTAGTQEVPLDDDAGSPNPDLDNPLGLGSGARWCDMNTSDMKAILDNIADPSVGCIELEEPTPESCPLAATQSGT